MRAVRGKYTAGQAMGLSLAGELAEHDPEMFASLTRTPVPVPLQEFEDSVSEDQEVILDGPNGELRGRCVSIVAMVLLDA